MALTEIEFVERLKAGTATVEEAIDFAKSRPKVNDSAKKRINALVSGFSSLTVFAAVFKISGKLEIKFCNSST